MAPVVLQLLCALPQALGTMRLWIRPTACSSRAVCHLPPLPPGSRPLRRPLFLSVCQEAGDTCGDRCTIWQGGADSRERGIKCLVPEGPPQAGEQLSLFLPSLRVSLLRYYKVILQAA